MKSIFHTQIHLGTPITFGLATSETTENNSEGLTRCPLCLASEGDQREMVTAVCKKCHMLVMMYKSSPACPNCKFMHSLDQSPPDIFNQTLRLLC
ncbi:unnamed protein product [Camellia sinensis]